ncbi:MAG: YhcB family protein [Deltaproteobacteria bacterium]|nr:YhcB family protein [Deltaproteobacteria bacterium]
MDSFFVGFISGLIVGLALAMILARLLGGFRWAASIFGRDPAKKKMNELEKSRHEAEAELERLRLRLNEKDALIRKAMASMADDEAIRSKQSVD